MEVHCSLLLSSAEWDICYSNNGFQQEGRKCCPTLSQQLMTERAEWGRETNRESTREHIEVVNSKKRTVWIPMTEEEIMRCFDVTRKTEGSNKGSQLVLRGCTTGQLAHLHTHSNTQHYILVAHVQWNLCVQTDTRSTGLWPCLSHISVWIFYLDPLFWKNIDFNQLINTKHIRQHNIQYKSYKSLTKWTNFLLLFKYHKET